MEFPIPYTPGIEKNYTLNSNYQGSSLSSSPKSGVFILKDDFEHGTLEGWINTADWSNSTEEPLNGLQSLKHEQGNGVSYIYRALHHEDISKDTIAWRFAIKNGNWIPSGNNKFWFYLYSDNKDLTSGPVNGYAAGVNMTGNDDYLKIWEVTNGTPGEIVIESGLKWGSASKAAIEVTRTPGGEWELKYNTNGEFANFTSAGKAVAEKHTEANWLGAVFVYTPTRAGLLWFDDIYSGPPIADTVAPYITKMQVQTPHRIKLEFSEKLEAAPALNTDNYLVNREFNPDSAVFKNNDLSRILLYFSPPFACSDTNILEVKNITDPSGNLMEPEKFRFTFQSLRLSNLKVLSEKRLRIEFTKPVADPGATQTSNYILDPGGINPAFAEKEIGNPEAVLLTFSEPFIQKTEYTLSLENLEDEHGNMILTRENKFIYYLGQPLDIVINEIMARPYPVVKLPEYEYVELYNRTGYPVDIGNWTLSVGNRVRVLPHYTIPPGEYLILCHPEAYGKMSQYGLTAAVENFPLIPMGGQTITLQNTKGEIISAVTYCDTWYKNDYKAEGGWSLEQIDPANPCGGKGNWTASVNISGGTPGQANSVKNENPDNSPPRLVRAATLSDSTVRLFFSKPLHPGTKEAPSDYIANKEAGHPDSVNYLPPHFKQADLYFSAPFSRNTTYTVTVENRLYDCAGNRLEGVNRARFAIADKAAPGDIVINEVLFNPPVNGVEFIELYNRSGKVIDLFDLVLAEINEQEDEFTRAYTIAPERYLLFPGEYAVVTTCVETLINHYYVPSPHVLIKIERLTRLNNDRGRIILADKGFTVIDEFEYEERMHHPLLTDFKGVSLERINFDRPSSDRTNWQSASQNAGFATPGYINSQFAAIAIEGVGEVTVDPPIFSPNNDGYNDITNISYEFDKPGYIANITIYDTGGRRIKRLVRNKLLGTSGVFSWDGRNEANMQSKIGMYLIHMEIFHPDGDVKHYKKTVVLGDRFE